MFENVVLGRRCSDKKFKEEAPVLRMKLFEAQRRCLKKNIPLLITVAGVDGAGRGAVINLLSEWMDNKHVHNHVFWMETDDERERPRDWRYWLRFPEAGSVGVFFGGRLQKWAELAGGGLLHVGHRFPVVHAAPTGPVIWVAGIRADERVRCTPQTKWLLELTLARDGGHDVPLSCS